MRNMHHNMGLIEQTHTMWREWEWADSSPEGVEEMNLFQTSVPLLWCYSPFARSSLHLIGNLSCQFVRLWGLGWHFEKWDRLRSYPTCQTESPQSQSLFILCSELSWLQSGVYGQLYSFNSFIIHPVVFQTANACTSGNCCVFKLRLRSHQRQLEVQVAAFICACFMERGWRVVLKCVIVTLVLGFCVALGDERDSVSSANQRCSDNRNSGRDAVLPAAWCVWCPDRGSLSFQGAALQALEGAKCLVRNSLAIMRRQSGCNYSRSITELTATCSDCARVCFKQTFFFPPGCRVF